MRLVTLKSIQMCLTTYCIIKNNSKLYNAVEMNHPNHSGLTASTTVAKNLRNANDYLRKSIFLHTPAYLDLWPRSPGHVSWNSWSTAWSREGRSKFGGGLRERDEVSMHCHSACSFSTCSCTLYSMHRYWAKTIMVFQAHPHGQRGSVSDVLSCERT